MKVIVKTRYRDQFTPQVIGDILRLLGKSGSYQLCYASGDGRNLIVETQSEKAYVIVSRSTGDGRNAFLAQYIPTVLRQYLGDCSALNKSIYLYLLDVGAGAKTDFILDTYRSAKTMGIRILNEQALGLPPVLPYRSFGEWKEAKALRQKRNRANKASYAIEDEDGYKVYGKLYGANGKESVFIACLLAHIAKGEGKSVVYIPVQEHDTQEVSACDRQLLSYCGVRFADGPIVLDGKKSEGKPTCRRQDEFRYRLLEKYGAKKCYLCDCDIDSNIIASHIHRITDIDGSALSDSEKRAQATDGDNGLWLCANHDKLFENGNISFDGEGRLVIRPDLGSAQRDYIRRITLQSGIEPCDFNDNMKKYMSYHNRRVKLGG